MTIPLKPIIYTTQNLKGTAPQSKMEQLFLLKSLQVTQDPKELQKLLGLRTVAQVYQAMDKLSMRKEYHESLQKNGIDFDFIVQGIKTIAISGFKDSDKLNAYKTLLKSVGMENYDEDSSGSKGNWEEVLLQKIEESKGTVAETEVNEYKVVVPEIPSSEKKLREEEREIISTLYDEPIK